MWDLNIQQSYNLHVICFTCNLCTYMYFRLSSFLYCEFCVYYCIKPLYSRPSQQRPPYLMWPYFCCCYYESIYFSLSSKATSLMWPQFLGKQCGLIREGLLYLVLLADADINFFSLLDCQFSTYCHGKIHQSWLAAKLLLPLVLAITVPSNMWFVKASLPQLSDFCNDGMFSWFCSFS